MNALRLKVLMLFLFMMGVEGAIYSQFNFVYNDSIVVIHDADTLPVAWAGGMSHPQFSTIDLDFDGVEELVAFELENGIVNVFKRQLHEGNVDRKSTRLNSSHVRISYAVFCLKK